MRPGTLIGLPPSRAVRPDTLRSASRCAGAAAILRILTTGKPVKDIDYDHVANKTEAFSGADLKAVLDVAVEAKLKQAMKTGAGIPSIHHQGLISAAKHYQAQHARVVRIGPQLRASIPIRAARTTTF